MTSNTVIRVYDIVGGEFCVSTNDGQALYEKIAPLIKGGCAVEVSFEKIETIISAFLNAAIGQLYGDIPEERIQEFLTVSSMSEDDKVLLARVVENAKRYFQAQNRFDHAWKEELGDEE